MGTKTRLERLEKWQATRRANRQATATRFDLDAWKAATERHLAGELTDSEYLEAAIPDPDWRAVVAGRLAQVREL